MAVMSDLTPETIAELDRLERAATPAGELALCRYGHGGGRLASPPGWQTEMGDRELVADFYQEAERELFFALRNACRPLLNRLAELEAENERLRAALNPPPNETA